MKIMIQKRTIFALLISLLLAGNAFAQSLPPLPPMPQGQLLDVWPFDGTNYLSLRRSAPNSLTNIALIPTWAGNGLQVDFTNAAWITYPMVQTNGVTNLNCSKGTIEMWFSPDWNSSDGLGAWGTILETGNWNTNVLNAIGAWGLYISPDGSGIYFSAQTNGVITNYLNAPISWNAGEWHYIVLTYSATNSALYLEGQLVTNGPGVSLIPGQNVLSNGFSIGSDSVTGLLQSRAVFNYVATYNYELDTNTIAEDYAEDAPNVFPLPSSGFGGGITMDFDGPPSPGGGGFGTNSGGGGYTFNAPHYGSNDFWVEPAGIDTNGMLTLLIHATTNNSTYAPVYELLWTESLTPPITWEVFETFLGATNTNITVLTVPVFPDEPAAFFEAVNLGTNGDSSGIGIPDWWQREYFGSVGIDPYGDPMSDGYDNLYKYEHGMNPNTSYAPAAPSFKAVLNTNGNVIISWPAAANLPSSGAGAVTGYTVQDVDPYTGTNYINLGSNMLSYESQLNSGSALANFVEYPTGYTTPPTYALQVNYSNGSSQWAQFTPSFDPTCSVNAAVARGPQGALYLAVSSVPENVSAIRIMCPSVGLQYPFNEYGYYYPNYFGDIQYLSNGIASNGTNWLCPFFDVPVNNITNGLYQIPAAVAPLFSGFNFVIAGIGTNGNLGTPLEGSPEFDWAPATYVGWEYYENFSVPFMDGRTNIQQNINLLLRGAGVQNPFTLYLNQPDGYNNGLYTVDIVLSQPTNYVWDGFCDANLEVGLNGSEVSVIQRNEFEPFEETSLFTNVVFNGDLFDSSGTFTNGLTVDQYNLGELDLIDKSKLFDAYIYATDNQSFPLVPIPPPVLNQDTESWICSQETYNFTGTFPTYVGCLLWDGSSWTLPVGSQNIYGLPILSVKYFGADSNWDVVGQGTVVDTTPFVNVFQCVAPPVLSTVNYYFARPQIDPTPGTANFTTTNATPSSVIIPFGQQSYFTAWAKQSVSNGYSGVFAYPQQYFDKAFMADANGNMSTNETGLLSEYGDFFPLQAGKIFLTTKPDAATGTVGTNVVNVVKLQLDVNHDGTMDTSFAGSDNTTADRPFVFWLNDDSDQSSSDADPGHDADEPLDPDYRSGHINSQRDLEDFARLWICGLPALPSSNGYQITLSWTNVTRGIPIIKLFNSVETNGGIAYLTNSNTAFVQSSSGITGPSWEFGIVSPNHPFTFPPDFFTNSATKCFLFEAAGFPRTNGFYIGTLTNIGGEGELVLSISQNGTNIASTSTFMDLRDVKDLYERAVITNTVEGWLTSAMSNWVSGIETLEPALVTDTCADTNIIVYIHGGNNGVSDWLMRADTIFKRLYWAGYHGKFSTVHWQTPKLGTVLTDYSIQWWNTTEFIGYKSAPALKSYLNQVREEWPGYRLNLFAHSAGSIITSEAIKIGAPYDTLLLADAGVSASCYDVNAPTNADLAGVEALYPTPNWQPMGYHGVYTNFSGQNINYFNPADSLMALWKFNQTQYKPSDPSVGLPYTYNGTYSTNVHEAYLVTDPQESRAMVARSRTLAIGGQGPNTLGASQGVIGSSLDVSIQFGIQPSQAEHSAFFTRPIQTIRPYYQQVLRNFQIIPAP